MWFDPAMGMADDARRRLQAKQAESDGRQQAVEECLGLLSSQLARLVPECVEAFHELGVQPRNLTPHEKNKIFQKRKRMGWILIGKVGYTHSDHSPWFTIEVYPDATWTWTGSAPAEQIENCLRYGKAPLVPEAELREQLSKQVTEIAGARGY
ncbi:MULTISPECIES: hypothetical protein [Nocardiaceae]|uniref:DUF1801 domain-containing protein n=1 Tax=Rhodococcoides kroppenstedtii TaxID=293050 RepID=A0ABS7NTD1_9NOCA|nr:MULTISPECIES: hypothetical protein [Rhodococcus]AMY20715.1 hypothetical protein A3Q40_03354 [Rhodococcus sp. PBTS 1]MBY6313373.1 hypothetical protein [Rhodococcus kroppenstedtii]MBY6321264.1 hypothetical protein [Rhodococcus kroppenstedtii]MBY6400319.1 hypothetical protein [Rhodococcus kroppenstedtii]